MCVKFRNKITATDSLVHRKKPFTGGLTDLVNENQLVVGWVCRSASQSVFSADNASLQYFAWDLSNKMLGEMIAGVMRRNKLVGDGDVELALLTLDTCLADDQDPPAIFLDFGTSSSATQQPYLKQKNLRYSEVSAEVTIAIMPSTASGGKPAQYRQRAEQEARLRVMYSN